MYGKVTDGSVDSDEQIVDPKFAKSALADWYDTGANVRQMHATTLPPAGKGVLLEHKDNDGEYVRTKVVEPVAVKLVDEGVYTGYSVGISRPRIDRDMKARGGRIVGGKIVEISLVDRPALPTAKFAVLKSAGNGLAFVGKVVLLDGDRTSPTERGPRLIKRPGRGMHVTAHVRTATGTEPIEGIVTERSRTGFRLDVRGFDRAGGERPIAYADVAAIYKGSEPVLKRDFDPGVGGGVDRDTIPTRDYADPKNRKYPIVNASDVEDAWNLRGHAADPDAVGRRIIAIARRKGFPLPDAATKASVAVTIDPNRIARAVMDQLDKGGFAHAHTHIGPDGVPHKHDHRHAAGTPDHGELHEGGPHAHAHPSTEDSVADDTKPQADAPDADDGATDDGDDVAKAHVHDFGDDGTCKCGVKASKSKKTAKSAKAKSAPAPDAAKADAPPADDDGDADADAAGGDDGDADDAPASDDSKKPFGGKKAPPFGKKSARVEERDGAFVVLKGGKANILVATYQTEPEATAKVAELHAEEAAAKTAAKAARAEKRTATKAARARKAARRKIAKAAAARQETPWQLRRLHDATCAAYDDATVKAAYPSVTKGNPFGRPARKALNAEMASALGAGKPRAVAGLGRAIAALSDLRRAQKVGGKRVRKAIAAARTDEFDAFKIANGLTEASDAGLPRPSQSVSAGQFRRPYISAGHQSEKASAHAAGIPTTTHPVGPNDFTRGPLTEGHQRYIASKLADLHDGLSEWRADLCRMDAAGSNAFDRQPVVATDRDLAKATLAAHVVDDRSDASPVARDPGKSKKAPGEKAVAPHVQAVTEAQIAAIVTNATVPLLNKITTLESDVRELAAAPDPSRSALRGVTGTPRTITKAATNGKARAKAGRREARSEKIDFYRSLARNGDPDQRIRADDWLARRGIDALD